eukprot:4058249-Alexandrium_andersonii.AAC.1
MQSLTSACKRAIDVGAQPMVSQPLLFASFGRRTPDPALEVLVRRIKLMRTMWHDPTYHGSAQGVLEALVAEGELGTCSDQDIPPT